MSDQIQIEDYAGGFIVVDYSGKRGKFSAAFVGKDGVWKHQPISLIPFETREAAEAWASANA
jgi:hypothetical protein